MSAEFVDSNLFVYAYDESAGERHRKAADLLARLWRERTGVLSVQVLQELFVTLTRKIPAPLTVARARKIVADLSAWPVHRPGPEDVLAAVDASDQDRISFWDAMILQSAAALGADIVWSEDLQSGRSYGSTVVRTPFDP